MPFTFNTRQKSVAFFILTGIFFVLVLVILIAKGSDLIVRKTHYWTRFSNTHNFTGGTDISYKGFTIGKIKKMTLNEDNSIHADFYLYDNYTRLLHTESVLRVQSPLLGASSLVLITFSLKDAKKNPVLIPPDSLVYSSDMFEGIEVLRKHRVATAESADELSDKLKIILDDVHNLRPELTNALTSINSTMKNIDIIAAGLRGQGKTALSEKVLASLENIRKITRNLEKTSENFNNRRHSIGKLLQDDGELITRIEKLTKNLEASSADIQKLSTMAGNKTKDIERIIKLSEENLIEMKKVLKGLQGVFGSGAKK